MFFYPGVYPLLVGMLSAKFNIISGRRKLFWWVVNVGISNIFQYTAKNGNFFLEVYVQKMCTLTLKIKYLNVSETGF